MSQRTIQNASKAIYSAFETVKGRPPTENELVALTAHSGVESSYGIARYRAWPGHIPPRIDGKLNFITKAEGGGFPGRTPVLYNFGASHCPSCTGDSYVWGVDRSPSRTKKGLPDYYAAKFHRFDTLEQGATHHVKLLNSERYREALDGTDDGDLDAYAQRLKAAGYYGVTAAQYARALKLRAADVREALGLNKPAPVKSKSSGATGGSGAILLWAAAGLTGLVLLRNTR